ncbi:MAG: hypothetical protein J7K22_02355 [Nanoarchaeota archaeon]|nr:hypothetical protein [Nanoarchaeota archaeon]
MNLQELCRRITIQHFRICAGLSYNSNKLKFYEKQLAQLSKKKIKKVKDEHFKLWLIGKIANYAEHDLYMEQIKERAKLFFDDVTYANWRSWLSKSNSNDRKKVFDYFMKKSNKIKNIVKKRFSRISGVYKRYGYSVLDAYLLKENLQYKRLVKKISKIGEKNKSMFDRIWKFLNVEKEYWNEYYYLRSIVFKNVVFTKEPLCEIKKLFKGLGFDFSRIKVDDKDRKEKFCYAYCFWPNPPKDVRVLYKPVEGYNLFLTVFHEFGHAAHAISMNEKLPFWKRFGVQSGVAETFSLLFESIGKEKNYLKSIGVHDKMLVKLAKLSDSIFLAFYSANSLVKLMFWNNEISFDELGKTYSKLLEEYTGLSMPEDYWIYHHILSEYSIYAPSYIVAYIRMNKLSSILRNRYGSRWWSSKYAGRYLKQIMSLGYDAIKTFKNMI